MHTDIWTTLIAGPTTSTTSVRQPANNSPVTSVTAPGITCNTPAAASTTTLVTAGSTVGFKLDNTLYHEGPAALYRERTDIGLGR